MISFLTSTNECGAVNGAAAPLIKRFLNRVLGIKNGVLSSKGLCLTRIQNSLTQYKVGKIFASSVTKQKVGQLELTFSGGFLFLSWLFNVVRGIHFF